MKTRFLAMMLAFVVIVTAGAQSLTSHEWAAETEAFKGATVTIMTSFDNDGTCTMLMFMDQEIERGTVMLAMIAPGTYTYDGKRLHMKIATGMAQFYDDVDMKASTKNLADKMNHVMKQEIEKAVPGMKKQFLSIVSDYSDLQVSRLTSSEMVTNIGTFKGLPRGSMEKMLSD